MKHNIHQSVSTFLARLRQSRREGKKRARQHEALYAGRSLNLQGCPQHIPHPSEYAVVDGDDLPYVSQEVIAAHYNQMMKKNGRSNAKRNDNK